MTMLDDLNTNRCQQVSKPSAAFPGASSVHEPTVGSPPLSFNKTLHLCIPSSNPHNHTIKHDHNAPIFTGNYIHTQHLHSATSNHVSPHHDNGDLPDHGADTTATSSATTGSAQHNSTGERSAGTYK